MRDRKVSAAEVKPEIPEGDGVKPPRAPMSCLELKDTLTRIAFSIE